MCVVCVYVVCRKVFVYMWCLWCAIYMVCVEASIWYVGYVTVYVHIRDLGRKSAGAWGMYVCQVCVRDTLP